MAQVVFAGGMFKTKRVVLWSTLLQFVLAVAAALMLYFGQGRLLAIVEIVAALGGVVFLLVLAFLALYYIRRPEVREKKQLQRQIEQVEKDLGDAQTDLAGALQKAEAIRERVQAQRNAAQRAFEERIAALEAQIGALRAAKGEKLASELARVQREYLQTGLKAIPLDPARVPGIGAALAEKLAEHGIRTAFDVDQEAIQAVPGFGESKILSLIRWRESEERALQNNQPRELPAETVQAIEQEYEQQVQALQEEKSAAQAAHEQAAEEMRAQEAQDLADAAALEIAARQRLTTLEAQKQEILARNKDFSRINFLGLLMAVLAGEPSDWRKRVVAALALLAFFITGLADIVILIFALAKGRL